MQPTDSPEQLAQNMPNNSLMFTSFTPTFGNLMFQIQPSMTGEVSSTYGTIPYLSLESLIYMQQIQAQTSPVTVLSGQNTGQQNITGAYTVTDNANNVRVAIGASNSSTGGF